MARVQHRCLGVIWECYQINISLSTVLQWKVISPKLSTPFYIETYFNNKSVLPITDQKEAETVRRVHRLPAQGQLRRLCTLSQRQVASDMQAETMREVDRKEG